MHHYHKLQELINTHPVGAPSSEEYLEILKILFHPEEVELATRLSFKLKKASEIAHETGIDREELIKKMEAMANRGVILAKKVAGEPAYALLPNYPGLFEYPVMKGADPVTERRLAELWHAYYMKEMAAELAAAVPPWNRVLPAEEAIPTEIEILPYEAATEAPRCLALSALLYEPHCNQKFCGQKPFYRCAKFFRQEINAAQPKSKTRRVRRTLQALSNFYQNIQALFIPPYLP